MGCLTGSRSANALARIPIEDVCTHRLPIWRMHAWRLADASSHDEWRSAECLCVIYYIDNLYSFGAHDAGAVSILVDAEKHLQERWGLQFGADSKMVMPVRGHEGPWAPHGDYKRVRVLPALGHHIADDASIEPCVTNTLAKMWGSFYGNIRRHTASLSFDDKVVLMDRAVTPQLLFRCPRWPWQLSTQARLNRAQNAMAAVIANLHPQPGESPAEFCIRRNGCASRIFAKKRWGDKWRHSLQTWSEHLLRPRNGASWAARLLAFHDRRWIQQRRLLHTSGRTSRTRTRNYTGKVHKRWDESVVEAASTV